MSTIQLSKTILHQITSTIPRPTLWSWGASKYQAVGENQIEGIGENYLGGLLFYVRGMKHKGHVIVSLALNDTYTITLGHVRKGSIKPKKQIKEVYCDEIGPRIDELIEKQDNYQF